MKLRKMRRRVIALSLSVAIIGTGNGISTFGTTVGADSQTHVETNEVNKQSESKLVETSQIGLQPEVVKEIKKERTENSNTYLMSDGTKKLELFATDIRYKENGEWVDYDTRLVGIKETDIQNLREINVSGASYSYANAQGNIKHYFADKVDEDTPVIMTKDDYEIRFAPVTTEKVIDSAELESMVESSQIIGSITNEVTSTMSENMETETMTDNGLTIENEISFSEINADNTSEIVYSNVNESVVYRYQSLTNGVKESIVLNEKPDTNVFEFAMDIPGMEAVVSEETNEILLKDAESKEVVAVVAPPNIMSGTDIPDYDNVEYKIVKKADGSYILKVVIDSEYLENASYPLVVDPTYMWKTDSSLEYGATLSVGGAASSVLGHSGNIVIMNSASTKGRLYVRIKNVDELLKGKYVYYSYLAANTYATSGDITVGVSRVLEDWDYTTLTWNNQPDISEEVYEELDTFEAEQYNHIVITDWTKDVACGEIADDYGIALSCTSGESSGYLNLYSLEHESSFGYLYVYYQDVEEIDASYDGTFGISAGTTENNDVQITWDMYSEDVCEYDIYARKNDEDSFSFVGKTTECEHVLDESVLGETTDIRVVAIEASDSEMLYDADNYLSNIVTVEKYTETVADDEGNETTETYYEQIVMDTDGDELEDGYEIWDFGTLWNTVAQSEGEESVGDESTESGATGSEEDTETEVTYDLDTDDDGFPDSYEVFTLGTDPAVANRYDENSLEIDSDQDGWSDYKEYMEGTDPWIPDSDFDGTIDKGDSTPRKTNSATSQTRAAQAEVHVGLYDRQYSETEDGVTCTYVTNIYRGEIKKIVYDYGNSNLNKSLKYFYDENGNNTAIIEAYDESYDPNHTQTICITYTYDADNNVTFICDQSTRYTMDYEDGEMTSLKVGNQELVSYVNNYTDNAEEDGDTSGLSVGDVISVSENTTIYGKETGADNTETGRVGTVKTVTTVYKIADDDTTSTETTEEIYYDNETTPAYKTEYTSDGKIKAFHDYTVTPGTDVVYTYAYGENGMSIKKGDDTLKTVLEESDEENGTSTVTTTYNFKDVKNENTTYSSVTITDTSEEALSENSVVLYNGDISRFNYDSDKEELVSSIYSTLYDKNILESTQTNPTSTTATFDIDIYAEDKSIDYVYDLAGNITQISVDDEVKYEYTYDAHGRLIGETDHVDGKYHEYVYNTTGNINAHWTYELDESGQPEENGTVKYSTYTNTDWPDQLSTYGGEIITYDSLGNPTEYLNGWEFEWQRGRQLSGIRFNDEAEGNESSEGITETVDNPDVIYRYNQDGLRTYKDTDTTTTVYEWDESTLIRETVTYKATSRTYDIWYFYDNAGSVIGFEYSCINDLNEKSTTRIYYEKDLQGNVVGLLDSRGAEIATYFYDAWGNITYSMCYEGYEVPFALNHITYRGYYRDDETGFYYLQSRYYDAGICRFINADDVSVLTLNTINAFNDNLYIYCNGNPINYTDNNGKIPLLLAAVLLLSVIGLTGCASSVKKEKKNYVPKYNENSNIVWKANMEKYNCYAYAISKPQGVNPGYYSGKKLKHLKVDTVLKNVQSDLEKLGFKHKLVNKNYTPKKNEHMIALRCGSSDYHFMKRMMDGSWTHKPGNTAILKLKGNPWDYSVWRSEAYHPSFGWITSKTTYDSKIYYIVFWR